MKKLVLLLSLMLSGCWYSDGCWYTPQMVNCGGDNAHVPTIVTFQKPETIGHTNVEQRWKDIENCGAKREKDSNHYEYHGSTDFSDMELQDCMKSKGYISLYDVCRTVGEAKKNGCNLSNDRPLQDDFKEYESWF